jgi:hypothetical protein
MQRRQSVPHTFAGKIAVERAKLEAELATLKHGPQISATACVDLVEIPDARRQSAVADAAIVRSRPMTSGK